MKLKTLFVTSLEKGAGGLVISMGLMEFLKRKIRKVAFLKPVILSNSPKNDDDIKFMIEYFHLKINYNDETTAQYKHP